ncbi:metallophosphoesterase [Geobacter sp. AOG2]|uniref:metallophosphoesterase family protein n=1 Tax=Geobacter sp. AOG2 TaxID=1566347 RepID=UPI001CC36D77|nr:metallophosphoesterase [Geobacter sp. AOG2]GFE59642.1 2,3-bisphosphoglycerate-independent phosphoglycerate mutase [Geobacter sp. AOG2]
MKIAWLTDMHLNFVGRDEFSHLCASLRTSSANATLITGDIATSYNLTRYLDELADNMKMPIFFVLGNHDYYGSSVREVNETVRKMASENLYLTWLSVCHGPIELSPDTCLIGHEGLADGRLGNPEGSTVILNDYYHIQELVQPTKEARLQVQHHLGDEAAAHLLHQLEMATTAGYSHILVALHVPPFPEACWHMGHNTDDYYLPHFGCKATGDVLRKFAEEKPMSQIDVYCGHVHSQGEAEILANLRVHTAGAEYREPKISKIIEV